MSSSSNLNQTNAVACRVCVWNAPNRFADIIIQIFQSFIDLLDKYLHSALLDHIQLEQFANHPDHKKPAIQLIVARAWSGLEFQQFACKFNFTKQMSFKLSWVGMSE